MRRKDESKKPILADFINAFYYEHDKVPSVREIVEGAGILCGGVSPPGEYIITLSPRPPLADVSGQ